MFSAGALLSALATGLPALLAGRAVSGAGAALLVPATMSVLLHASPPDRRAGAGRRLEHGGRHRRWRWWRSRCSSGTVNAQFLQYVKGYSPLQTGTAIVPLAFGMMAVTKYGMRGAERAGEARTAGAGLVLIATGLLLLSTADAHTPYPLYLVFLLVMSAGAGLAMPPLSHAIVASVPARRSGMGSGLQGAARELGAALGIAVVGTVLSVRFASGTGHGAAAVTAFTDAMALGYRIAAGVVLVVGVAVVTGLRTGARAGRARR